MSTIEFERKPSVDEANTAAKFQQEEQTKTTPTSQSVPALIKPDNIYLQVFIGDFLITKRIDIS